MRQRHSACIAVLLALLAAADCRAAIVQYKMTINTAAHTWELRASDLSGPTDNVGIVSYGVVLENVTSVDHRSPRDGFAQGPKGVGAAAFTTLRTADNVATILASQDWTTPTPNIVFGFGQTAGSFAALGLVDFTGGTQVESPTWDADLLIASGTYGSSLPSINAAAADTFVGVFAATIPVTTKAAVVQTRQLIIPEPPTAPLAAGLALALALSLRHTAHARNRIPRA